MDGYDIAELKTCLGDVVSRVEAGETVEIQRRGKPVARIVPLDQTKKKVDWTMLDALAMRLPRQTGNAVDIIRDMRDTGY
jgi:prevent-host-death family protein